MSDCLPEKGSVLLEQSQAAWLQHSLDFLAVFLCGPSDPVACNGVQRHMQQPPNASSSLRPLWRRCRITLLLPAWKKAIAMPAVPGDPHRPYHSESGTRLMPRRKFTRGHARMHSYESCYGSTLCRKTHVAFRPQHLPISFWKIHEQTPHERGEPGQTQCGFPAAWMLFIGGEEGGLHTICPCVASIRVGFLRCLVGT